MPTSGCVGAGSGRRDFEGRSSASPSEDWQARASRAVGGATRRSYAQCTRHTGNDLVSIALTGWVLRLNAAASNPPRLSIYTRCSAFAEDAARTSLFRVDCVELFNILRNFR